MHHVYKYYLHALGVGNILCHSTMYTFVICGVFKKRLNERVSVSVLVCLYLYCLLLSLLSPAKEGGL